MAVKQDVKALTLLLPFYKPALYRFSCYSNGMLSDYDQLTAIITTEDVAHTLESVRVF